METVTHIAGLVMVMPGRLIQRCALCGEKLCDSKDGTVALNEDGTASGYPRWDTGRHVRITFGNPQQSELLAESDQLPPDSCLALVE